MLLLTPDRLPDDVRHPVNVLRGVVVVEAQPGVAARLLQPQLLGEPLGVEVSGPAGDPPRHQVVGQPLGTAAGPQPEGERGGAVVESAEVGNTVDNQVGKVGDGGEEPPGQLFLVEVNGLVAGLETGPGEKCKESS